jgi:hypothetical protein
MDGFKAGSHTLAVKTLAADANTLHNSQKLHRLNKLPVNDPREKQKINSLQP